MLGVALSRSVLAFGIVRPVEREAVASQPFAEIGPTLTERTLPLMACRKPPT
jgi:hypothetical protein